MLSSIGISLNSIRTTSGILDPASRHWNIWRSALPMGCQRHVCLDYEISSVENANGKHLQILSAVIIRTRFGSAVVVQEF